MIIDLPTLMLAASFVAAVSGAFLFFAWLQNREAKAPLWWAGANLSLAIGVPLAVLLRHGIRPPVDDPRNCIPQSQPGDGLGGGGQLQ